MSEPPVPVKEPPKKSDSVFSKIFAKKEKRMAPLNPDKILEVKKGLIISFKYSEITLTPSGK